jgi:hypothetical protein
MASSSTFYKHIRKCRDLALLICKTCNDLKVYLPEEVKKHTDHEVEHLLSTEEQKKKLKVDETMQLKATIKRDGNQVRQSQSKL